MSFHRIKPILFNTEMVRAIRAGRKTVTRRVIKPRNAIRAKKEGYKQGGYGLWIDPSTDNGDKQGHIKDYSISDMWSTWNWYIDRYAPYHIGDFLYVRETWCRGTDIWNCEKTSPEYFYKEEFRDASAKDIKWKPSIHMPKEAARIWLIVTDVRVERLQDMTEDDVVDEGAEKLIYSCEHIDYTVVPPEPCFNTCNACKDCIIDQSYQEQFGKMVWNSTINKKDIDSYGWDANPWVWVIEFERIER